MAKVSYNEYLMWEDGPIPYCPLLTGMGGWTYTILPSIDWYGRMDLYHIALYRLVWEDGPIPYCPL